MKIDYILIPGDITNCADPKEVLHASKFLEWIATILGVPEDRILAIPGNHDLHWRVCEIDNDGHGFWSQFRYAPYTHQSGMLSTVMTAGGQLLASPYFLIKQSASAILCGVNSAALDYPTTRPHHGHVPQSSIEALDAELEKIPFNAAQYRIGAVHHHPLNYSDLDPHYADFSVAVNAENLLCVLIKHHFDILIHGHKHVPFFQIYTRDGVRRMPVLGAGSFSANLVGPIYQGRILNQLHVIEFTGRENDTNAAYGSVRTWAHISTSGWVKSIKAHHGLPHLCGSGKYSSYD